MGILRTIVSGAALVAALIVLYHGLRPSAPMAPHDTVGELIRELESDRAYRESLENVTAHLRPSQE